MYFLYHNFRKEKKTEKVVVFKRERKIVKGEEIMSTKKRVSYFYDGIT